MEGQKIINMLGNQPNQLFKLRGRVTRIIIDSESKTYQNENKF